MPRGGKRPGAGRKRGATAPYETLAVRVPPELLARLEDAAERAGMSLADYVRHALGQHLRMTAVYRALNGG